MGAIHFSPLPCSVLGQGVAISTTAFMLARFFAQTPLSSVSASSFSLWPIQWSIEINIAVGNCASSALFKRETEHLCLRPPKRRLQDLVNVARDALPPLPCSDSERGLAMIITAFTPFHFFVFLSQKRRIAMCDILCVTPLSHPCDKILQTVSSPGVNSGAENLPSGRFGLIQYGRAFIGGRATPGFD